MINETEAREAAEALEQMRQEIEDRISDCKNLCWTNKGKLDLEPCGYCTICMIRGDLVAALEGTK